jgi:hypothetical protein
MAFVTGMAARRGGWGAGEVSQIVGAFWRESGMLKLRREAVMGATLEVRDETTSGTVSRRFTLEFPTERVTVQELIRERVYQEVDEYNRRQREGKSGAGAAFQGLVQPTDAEVALNGFKVKKGREIDWKKQFEKACEAYERNQVLVLVGEKQTEGLEEVIEIGRGTEVTFLRLVMLVGG